jgi:hypothetical protein
MPLARQELLVLIEVLRKLSRLPADRPEVYERIRSIAGAIERHAPGPDIAALALDARFKAEDLFDRPHLMPEETLREMLETRLQRLEALARASVAPERDRRKPGVHGRRATDRDASGTDFGAITAALENA